MNELEDQLHRYRPVGPPRDLRARVVAAARPPARHRWVWVPPAAAAAAAVMFYVLAANARHDLSVDLTRTDPAREAVIRALAADLGGGDEAGALATRVIEMNEAAVSPGNEPRTAPGVEGNRQ